MSSENILEIQGVTKTLPGVKALDNVSFTVQKGEVHGVVGENGAGKSTLMKILSGVYKRDNGSITFDGKEFEASTPQESMKSGLSIIYQELNLVNLMSVGENIFLGRFNEAGGMKGVHKKAKELLQSIESDIDTHAMVGDLSISQKQMVEIAKALSLHAKLIIMDEPSTTLTTKEMKHLTKLINQLKANGITIIYISHKLQEIYDLCDRVTVMRDGHVIGTDQISNITREQLITMMVGRTIENEYPPRPDCVGETILQVKGLYTKKLKDISFELKAGEILGMVGLVGAGRTEIVRAIFGADKKRSGEILLDGKSINIKGPLDAKKYGIGFITEDRKEQGLALHFSVEDNITMTSFDHFSRAGVISNKKKDEITRKQIASLSIKTPKTSTKVLNLSGGNQQKCVVAKWLETDPRILFLDEPTRGIDVGAKYEIYMIMKRMAEEGRAVIMISSELDEVLNLANRVLAISDGRIVGEFHAGEVTAQDIMSRILK